LYVEPIYIQSENEESAIPELRQVVVGYKEKVEWGQTLDLALRKLFNVNTEELVRRTPVLGDISTKLDNDASIFDNQFHLVERANLVFQEAVEAQRLGNWSTYGEKLNQLEKTLKQLEKLSETSRVKEE